ncbi:MAG: TIGR04372 family glycosyltransferase [Candidatus Thermoplasmatota archaeon]|nr:TIGR04372 family glycosyltransferase [Candidatus Thermoplasmatota archaeon]
MTSINYHLKAIRVGGVPILGRKIQTLFMRILAFLFLSLNSVWAILGVLIIRSLRPWRIIRLGTLKSNRIGHLVADSGHQWAMIQQQSKKILDLYWLDWSRQAMVNDFWIKMIRRNFTICLLFWPLDFWNQILPGGEIHHRPTSITGSRDIHGYLEHAEETMRFLPDEDKDAKAWMRLQGWQDGDPFVCLLVRDNQYLQSDPQHIWRLESQKDFWHYQKYRDSDIATYEPAAEWLANQGVWVFRMGKIMGKSISSNHPRIIDYAFHPDRSDFLDVWLFAHCNLCITTGVGPDMISDVYRRPILALNFLPLSYSFSWSDAMHLPKTLVWQETGVPLTLKEHLDNNYLQTEQYIQAGIQIIDLTPEEILSAVQERWQRIQGTWVDSEDDIARHQRFWNVLKSHQDFDKYHGWVHPEARGGALWLRSMGEEFFS